MKKNKWQRLVDWLNRQNLQIKKREAHLKLLRIIMIISLISSLITQYVLNPLLESDLSKRIYAFFGVYMSVSIAMFLAIIVWASTIKE